MAQRWQGDVWIGPGAAYYVGDARDNDQHAHYVLQVAVALGEPFYISEGSSRTHLARGIVIPSGKRHCLRNAGRVPAETLMLFLEPNSDYGRLIHATFGLDQGDIVEIGDDRLSALKRHLATAAPGGGEPLVREIVDVLTGGAWRHRGVDRRVAFALDYIEHHLAEQDSLDRIAERLSLTSRYLRRLFEQEIGLSPLRYRQWCKLRRALTGVLNGESFTDAAASAGFTDSAHFSRTFRDMFGAPPSAIFEAGGSDSRSAQSAEQLAGAATLTQKHFGKTP